VGRNQNGRPSEGVVSPVGDVVKYLLHCGTWTGKIKERKEKIGRVPWRNREGKAFESKSPLKPPDAG
jgi:hypothetical protein